MSVRETIGLFMAAEADAVLEEVCARDGVDPRLVRQLLQIEQNYAGMRKRRGLFEELDAAIAASASAPRL